MLATILAAFGMVADGVAEGLYALRHGFSARAAGVAYGIGAVFAWFSNAVTPLTFTVESIAVATRTAKKRPEILYIVVLSALPSIALGVLGLYSTFVELLDDSVIAGAIGGVGIILARVGVDYVRERPIIAGSSVLAGFGVYLLTQDLVLVIISAVALGTALYHLVPEGIERRVTGAAESPAAEGDEGGEDDHGGNGESDGNRDADGGNSGGKDKIGLVSFDWRAMLTRSVMVGAFSVFALRTGAVVSYDTVNANIAGQQPTLDAVTLMAGLGSLASGLLGGPPLETTPAPMAAAPQPVMSTVIFMALMAGVTLLGLVQRVGTFVPLQAIAGFLVVLGIPVIMPEQLPAIGDSPLAGGTALVVTALTNPFYGIISGEVVALLGELGIGQDIGGNGAGG